MKLLLRKEWVKKTAVLFVFTNFLGYYLSPCQAADRPRARPKPTHIHKARRTTRILNKQTLSSVNLIAGSGVSVEEGGLLTDRLLMELAWTGCFEVTDRTRRDEILGGASLRNFGACDEPGCLSQAGKSLGVQRMVGGYVEKVGNSYSILLKVVNVESGIVAQTLIKKYSGPFDDFLSTSMKAVAGELARSMPALEGFPPNRFSFRSDVAVAESLNREEQRRHFADSLGAVEREKGEVLKTEEQARLEKEREGEYGKSAPDGGSQLPFSLYVGYGTSFGGYGGSIRIKVSSYFSLLVGGGYTSASNAWNYPGNNDSLSSSHSSTGAMLFSGGIQFHPSLANFSNQETGLRGYWNLEFGGMDLYYPRDYYYDSNGMLVYRKTQMQVLWGPYLTAGLEYRLTKNLGVLLNFGGGYNISKADSTAPGFLVAVDYGVSFNF